MNEQVQSSKVRYRRYMLWLTLFTIILISALYNIKPIPIKHLIFDLTRQQNGSFVIDHVTVESVSGAVTNVLNSSSLSNSTSNNLQVMKTNNCFQLSWNISKSLDFYNPSGTKLIGETGCGRFLTKRDFIGRMGNQMFQIASLIGLSCKYDFFPIILESTCQVKEYFDLPNIVNVRLKTVSPVKCIGDKFATFYNCSEELGSNSLGIKEIGAGYYIQSWKFFEECQNAVRQTFKLKQNHVVNVKNFLSNISINGSTLVCIHVRRGDMLQRKEIHAIDEGFIKQAQQFYIQNYATVTFIVLSDDIEWCKRKLMGKVVYSPFTNPGDDMALMASCDHVIVTVGTFGWWGAWLSNGTTVYQKNYIREDSGLIRGIKLEDYYPPNWIAM